MGIGGYRGIGYRVYRSISGVKHLHSSEDQFYLLCQTYLTFLTFNAFYSRRFCKGSPKRSYYRTYRG